MTKMRELAQKATPGPWMLADSCSWRRILTARHEPVCVPTIIDSDNHPDLLLHGPKGMHDNGPFIAACSPERILAYEDCVEALRHIQRMNWGNAAGDNALAALDALEEP